MNSRRTSSHIPYLLQMPHPMVTLAGVMIFGSLVVAGIYSGGRLVLLPIVLMLLPIWFAVRRRSIEQQRKRHEAELDKLRHQTVLHLND